MSELGLATTAPAGAHEDQLQTVALVDSGDGISALLTVTPATGYGNQYFVVVCDGIPEVRYISEGATARFSVVYDTSYSEHVVSVIPNGDWPDLDDIDYALVQQEYMEDKGKNVLIRWDPVIEVADTDGDNAQFASWSLSGLVRGYTGRAISPTELELDVILSTVAGVHTVQLAVGEQVLAQGSITGDGTVTLSEVDASGLSATVALTYSGDLALGTAMLRVRYAASYQVHCATSLSFPRTPELVVYDSGVETKLSGVIKALPAGTYNYVVRAVSNTGVSGTNATAGTIIVPGRPDPVDSVVYSSGGYSDTVIEWVGSTTSGATYRIYDSGAVNTPIDYNTPTHTVSSPSARAALTVYSAGDFVLPTTLNGYRYECTTGGTTATPAPTWPTTVGATVTDGTVVWTCRRFRQQISAIAAAAGVRRVAVVAVASGREDGYRVQVAIEYDAAGAVILPRPNTPDFIFISAAGLTASVNYSYTSANEAGTATHVKLRLKAEDGTITAFDAIALGAASAVRTGTLTGAAPAAGLYRYRVNALAGLVESDNTEWLDPVWLSDSVPAAPANVEAYLR